MSDDLVARLRETAEVHLKYGNSFWASQCIEAAAEIERLRTRVKELIAQLVSTLPTDYEMGPAKEDAIREQEVDGQ